MLSSEVLGDVLYGFAMRLCAGLCHAMLCCAMHCYATAWQGMACYATLKLDSTLHNIMVLAQSLLNACLLTCHELYFLSWQQQTYRLQVHDLPGVCKATLVFLLGLTCWSKCLLAYTCQIYTYTLYSRYRYVNQPQPELQGSSVTLKATEDRIQHMHMEADQIWPPELAQLMKVCTR